MIVDNKKFITGKPVETEYATFRFLKFEEYIDCQEALGIISLSTLNLYYSYKKAIEKPNEEEAEFLKILKDTPLREIILSDKMLLEYYIEIIGKVAEFKEDYGLEYIFETEENFMEVRKMIMDMNLAKEEKAFYNEELQTGLERKKKMQSMQNGESQTSEDIITSITTMTSHTLEQVLNMSIYQAYAIYSRVSAIENYRTGVTFATVSGDTKKLEPWNKHIDILKEDSKDGITRSQFEANMGGF